MLTLHLFPDFDETLTPTPGRGIPAWWDEDPLTQNHARHCYPLVQANTCGYDILSPADLTVQWDEDGTSIQVENAASHAQVDAHSATGSVTVQARFIPRTYQHGHFVWIGPVPNMRQPFKCMEALVEAWWAASEVGLVLLLNQQGSCRISRGEPIARMRVFCEDGGQQHLDTRHEPHPGWHEWHERRTRPGFQKDLDYLKGLYPDQTKVPHHVKGWRRDL